MFSVGGFFHDLQTVHMLRVAGPFGQAGQRRSQGSGDQLAKLPDAVSVKISAQRSPFSAHTLRVKSCCVVLTRA